MLPWVVLGFMLIISLLITVIYQTVMFLIDGLLVTALVWLVVTLLITGNESSKSLKLPDLYVSRSAALFAYFWTVCYSYFTELREESKRGKYNRQPYRR